MPRLKGIKDVQTSWCNISVQSRDQQIDREADLADKPVCLSLSKQHCWSEQEAAVLGFPVTSTSSSV